YPTPCETFQYGEVEDYTIDIREADGGSLPAATTPTTFVTLYPNPSIGESKAILELGDKTTTVSIILADSRGKTIISKELKNVSGTISQSFSTTDLRKGIYYVSVRSTAINEVQKLIVE